MDSKLTAAAEWLRGRLPHPPLVGVILGSGLGDFADGVDERVTIAYRKIPGFPASAVVFPARVLGLLGCRTVIVTNAAGGIDKSFRSGNLMLIDDHINAFGTNPLVGANDEDLGPRFPDMSEPYDRRLGQLLDEAAAEVGVTLQQGVYAGVLGPSYETPAEIRMLRTLGADLVGMSTVHEVIAAHHQGVPVAGISVVTNLASGLSAHRLTHEEVQAAAARVRVRLEALLAAFLPRAAR